MALTDKEVLQKARELVANGLVERKAIIKTLQIEALDAGRRAYLWNYLTRKLREDSKKEISKGQIAMF